MRARAIFLAAVFLAAPLAAAEFKLVPDKSSLTFQPKARFGDNPGSFRHFDVTAQVDEDALENSTLEAVIDVKSIDTGIKKRDHHLCSPDFFAADQFPTATIKILKVRALGGNQYEGAADITIRGTRKATLLPVAAIFEGDYLHLVGKTAIQRKEFGISYDSVLNPIQDRVEVMYDLVLAPLEK